jgi:hypothetical protein
MRKLFLLVTAMLAGAAVASASGINLSWDNCSTFGNPYEAFACNTNTGAHRLVGSFVAPAGVSMMTANEISIEIQSAGPMPSWWEFYQPGSCRQASLVPSFDFTGLIGCLDSWHGAGYGGIAAYQTLASDRRKIVAVVATDYLTAGPLSEGSEYYSFIMDINNDKTVGAGSCAGCDVTACIQLTSIRLDQPVGFGDYTLTNPVISTFALWQPALTGPGCPGVVPNRHSTWGAVKSLYR